jgi:PAS domain S-box-containing protein
MDNPTYQLEVGSGRMQWNDAFYATFGYEPADANNTLEWWTGHIHPEDAMRVDQAMDQLLDTTRNDWTAEYRLEKADGSYVQVQDQVQVDRDEKGQAFRVNGTITLI